MGDRGNIVIKEAGGGTIYLYTHWTGSELPGILAEALARGTDRWHDDPYLARIIFCEMVKSDINGTTGFGISATMGDGGTDIYVDVGDKRVGFRNGDADYSGTFEEFIIEFLP